MVGLDRLNDEAHTAVLFLGIMNLFYVVWDYIDERLFDKRNTSDCAQFSELLGWPTAGKSSLFLRSLATRADFCYSLGYILVLI